MIRQESKARLGAVGFTNRILVDYHSPSILQSFKNPQTRFIYKYLYIQEQWLQFGKS